MAFKVRSKQAQEKVNLNIQVPPELIERLEIHARRNEISRTALVRQMVQHCLQELDNQVSDDDVTEVQTKTITKTQDQVPVSTAGDPIYEDADEDFDDDDTLL